MTADEIKAYYANLLIIQYNNKPKAWATIAALVNQVAQLDLLIFAMRSGGFTLDNAVGAQLDILGSWLGVRRYYYGVDTSKRYFGMPEYGDSFPAFLGFLRYGDDPASTQYFKQYSDLSPTSGLLGDGDFRRFLKYIAGILFTIPLALILTQKEVVGPDILNWSPRLSTASRETCLRW